MVALALPTGDVSQSFDCVEDYVDFMRDPKRVVRLEWRKVRRGESKGMTSHSWLEARLMDGIRVRIELWADQGFSVSLYDPTGRRDPRFTDPEAKVYDNRAAEAQDFRQPLTLTSLSDIAKNIGNKRPYSLSEFNCHHFVLDVWNNVVIDKLQATHYPDRTKTSLLWGVEGAIGTWLQTFGGSLAPGGSLAAPVEGQTAAPLTRGYSASDRTPNATLACFSGSLQAAGLDDPNYGRARRLATFCQLVKAGKVFLVEPGTPLIHTGVPPRRVSLASDANPVETTCSDWVACCLPGVGNAGMRLAERMNGEELGDFVSEVFLQKETESSQAAAASPFTLASISSLSSISRPGGAEPQLFTRDPLVEDACFVALRGRELRWIAYCVLRCPGAAETSAWRLRLLSGDALAGKEGSISYFLTDLVEATPTTQARDLLDEDMPALSAALSTDNWGALECL
eukprot:TRINITY_DN50924_c0_g1_i2.p1 TRINITY_DN50924_c0_g1~~TRINITY_DN50924_c0_g1_i2.p1  ORF type:complete len:454 (-),score=60.30 TRINITY_DN50924_c0_g1_i2:114-1475(-)